MHVTECLPHTLLTKNLGRFCPRWRQDSCGCLKVFRIIPCTQTDPCEHGPGTNTRDAPRPPRKVPNTGRSRTQEREQEASPGTVREQPLTETHRWRPIKGDDDREFLID